MEVKEMSVFPTGEPNNAFAQYFQGQSYLNMLSTEQVAIGNVTFEPGCRNNWHIHHADKGGGQMLLVTAGRGYYQEWGKEARELRPRIPGSSIWLWRSRGKTAAMSGASP